MDPGKFEIYGKAILFDMDGTLVDSTPCVERVWRKWGERHGIALEDILAVSHGRMTRDTVRAVASHLDPDAEAETLHQISVTDSDGILAIVGARRLLDSLAPGEWAVVTSAPHNLAHARLEFAGLPVPACLVGAEDVRAGKPDPEGFLKAAQLLSVAPADCTVVEDTPAGIQAARAAGMHVLAVGTTFPREELLGAPWVRNFSGVTFRRA